MPAIDGSPAWISEAQTVVTGRRDGHQLKPQRDGLAHYTRSFTMVRKAILAVAVLAAFIGHAQAADSFNVGAGFSSSVTLSGGSSATSGSNGQGYSTQTSNSAGYGYAAGGTAMGVGAVGSYAYNGVGAIGAGGSFSGAVGGSNTTSTSSGYTSGDGYGATKGGAGVDYSAGGYSGLSGSYAY